MSWTVQPTAHDQGETTTITDDDGFSVCTIASPAWDETVELEHPCDRDNAYQIAASSDLLTSLRDILGRTNSNVLIRAIGRERFDTARAAIAKTTTE